MTLPGPKSTAVLLLLLFSLFAAATTAEDNKSPTSIHSDNHTNHTNSGDYSSAAFPKLSTAYFVLSLVYLFDLGFWIAVCVKVKPSHRRIHFMMSGLLIMKIIDLICSTFDKVTDSPHSSSDSNLFLLYVNQSISVVRVSIVILLICHGWPFVKPILREIDVQVLSIIIPVQVVATVASIVMELSSDGGIWEGILILAYIITACAMVITCVSSIRSIRSTMIGSRLTLVRNFYLVVTLYLLQYKSWTGQFEGNNGAIDANYNQMWKAKVAVELLGFMFYRIIFKMFKGYFEKDEE